MLSVVFRVMQDVFKGHPDQSGFLLNVLEDISSQLIQVLLHECMDEYNLS